MQRVDGEGRRVWERLLEGVGSPYEPMALPFKRREGERLGTSVPIAPLDLPGGVGSSRGFAVAAVVDGDPGGNRVWGPLSYAPLGFQARPTTLSAARDGGVLALASSAAFAHVAPDGALLRVRALDSVEETVAIAEPENGDVVVLGRDSDGAAALVRITPSDAFAFARAYPLEGFDWGSEGLHLAPGPDGGFVIGGTIASLEEPDARALEEGVFQGGGQNALVLKVDAEGTPLWYRVHGGLQRECVTALAPTADGGLLVGGHSGSLRDGREAWVLRLGYDGRVGLGCNADLGGGAWPAGAVDLVGTVKPATPASTNPVNLLVSALLLPKPRTGAPIVARQCFGSGVAYEPPTEEEEEEEPEPPTPAEDPVLTVVLAGTAPGTVQSVPVGIDCGTVCSTAFPAGTTVHLRAFSEPGGVLTGWEGVDVDRGTAGAEVTLAQLPQFRRRR